MQEKKLRMLVASVASAYSKNETNLDPNSKLRPDTAEAVDDLVQFIKENY